MNEKLIPNILETQAKTLVKWPIILLIINIILTLVDPYSTTTDITGQVVSGCDI